MSTLHHAGALSIFELEHWWQTPGFAASNHQLVFICPSCYFKLLDLRSMISMRLVILPNHQTPFLISPQENRICLFNWHLTGIHSEQILSSFDGQVFWSMKSRSQHEVVSCSCCSKQTSLPDTDGNQTRKIFTWLLITPWITDLNLKL